MDPVAQSLPTTPAQGQPSKETGPLFLAPAGKVVLQILLSSLLEQHKEVSS